MKKGDIVFINEKSYGNIGFYKCSCGKVESVDEDGDPTVYVKYKYIFALKHEVTVIPKELKDASVESIKMYLAL